MMVVPHFETVACYFYPLSPIISQLGVADCVKIIRLKQVVFVNLFPIPESRKQH